MKKLRALMALNGITQAQLAEKLNISPGAMSQKMNYNSEFTHSEIKKILKIFNVKFEDIWG